MARATRTCTLAVLALACCCACAQAARRVLAEESPSAAWQRNTQVQCPKLAKQSCGWLSEAEEEATTNGTCLYCGTVWKGGIRSLPVGLSSGGASYYVKAGRLVGLGCKGKVTIMTVFRVESGGGCFKLDAQALGGFVQTAGTSTGTLTRCELPGDANATLVNLLKRVQELQEKKCVQCSSCHSDAPCISKTGQWYSDTLSFDIPSTCPHRVDGPLIGAVSIDPSTTAVLAKMDISQA